MTRLPTFASLALCCLCLPVLAGAAPFTLAREGRPSATIVIPADPSPSVGFAAAELQYHVKLISGALLPVVTDDKPVAGPRILVGDSAATKALGLRGGRLREEEHLIRFLPDTLVLLGRDPRAAERSDLPEQVAGRFGSAQQFRGGQVIEMRDLSFPDERGTMEAWAYLPAAQTETHGTILRLDGGGPWTYHIIQRDLKSNAISYTTYDGTHGHGVRSGPLPEGWHHVVATHDVASARIELFIDGKSVGTDKYVKTTCNGAPLGIGATGSGVRPPGNAFVGLIDEVRLTSDVRTPASGAGGGPYEPDEGTVVLMHLDRQGALLGDDADPTFRFTAPSVFQSNGTLQAVYDFLERYCEVRWYAPGKLGEVYPSRPTLSVTARDLQRRPAMAYRWIAGAQLFMPTPATAVPAADRQAWLLRNRLGGNYQTCGHSFYGYYDRFLKEHPDWFAQGYPGQPPQMCYTNPGFIAQVVKDANDYFEGKGARGGAAATGDIFGLVPMDNSSWCKCPRCQAELNTAEKDNPQFSNGWASDYIFRFTNKVAREVAKTHPDKWIGQLAYSTYAYYPTSVVPESNVAVQMCLHTRNWWCPSMEANDRKILAAWSRARPRRPLHLWLYYCFPALNGRSGNYSYFPGFFAHTVVKQMKLYHDSGVMGIFLENSSECDATYLMDQLEYYVTFRLADDPSLDGNRLIEEFFTRYYGSAAAPMRALYCRIEDLYSNPRYYPPEIRNSPAHQHQNEELAWKWLGTPERIAELGKLIDQAVAAARTPEEKQRVELFREGIWQPLAEGRKKYESHLQGRAQAPRTVQVPRLAAAADLARLDWAHAADLGGWGGLSGDPTDLKFETRIAHDGSTLYLQLRQLAPRSLSSGPSVWDGDDWELFFAAERNGSYRQLCIAPNGKTYEAAYKPAGAWPSGAVVQSSAQQGRDWTVSLALPLASLAPGVTTSHRFYANFYRNGPGAAALLAWTPPYANGFHDTARLAEFQLQ